METTKSHTKINYPVTCKHCKKHITYIQISADLWEKKDKNELGVSNIRCSNCMNKK